jgi:hypothetical protein
MPVVFGDWGSAAAMIALLNLPRQGTDESQLAICLICKDVLAVEGRVQKRRRAPWG